LLRIREFLDHSFSVSTIKAKKGRIEPRGEGVLSLLAWVFGWEAEIPGAVVVRFFISSIVRRQSSFICMKRKEKNVDSLLTRPGVEAPGKVWSYWVDGVPTSALANTDALCNNTICGEAEAESPA
jgi:hypothetical protein